MRPALQALAAMAVVIPALALAVEFQPGAIYCVVEGKGDAAETFKVVSIEGTRVNTRRYPPQPACPQDPASPAFEQSVINLPMERSKLEKMGPFKLIGHRAVTQGELDDLDELKATLTALEGLATRPGRPGP